MARRPTCFQCPRCSALSVNRRRKRCPVCGVRLLYRGDWFFTCDDAYHWMGEGWVHVEALTESAEQPVAIARQDV